MTDDDLATVYLLGAEHMRDKLQKQAEQIERLRIALFNIVNEVGFHNHMRMTTEISDKVLFEAARVLDEKIL